MQQQYKELAKQVLVVTVGVLIALKVKEMLNRAKIQPPTK